MVEDHEKAFSLLDISAKFICGPMFDLRSDLINFTLEEFRESQVLPFVYRPRKIQVQFEIGKFLLKKLTYAPYRLDACKEILYNYDAYDLHKVLESLSDAIVTNHPDIVNKSVGELSEILDNVWTDKTIPKRIENIKTGVPVSIAAIGAVAGGLIGGLAGLGTGGFLAELGFKVGQKLVDVEAEKLPEKIAKLRTRSYQVNIYDFKKKYKHKITHS